MITLIRLAAKYPIFVILSILVITVVAFSQIEGLKIQVSAQGLIAEDDPARQQYQQMLDTFGSSDSIVIIIRDMALSLYQLQAVVFHEDGRRKFFTCL